MSNMEALKKARKEHNQRKVEHFMLVRKEKERAAAWAAAAPARAAAAKAYWAARAAAGAAEAERQRLAAEAEAEAAAAAAAVAAEAAATAAAAEGAQRVAMYEAKYREEMGQGERFLVQMIAKEWCPGGNLAAMRLQSLGKPVTKEAVISLAPQFVPKPRRR